MCDSAPGVSAGLKGSLLTTRPAFSNLSPLVPCNQVTPFRGKGLNGQSVAIKTATTATTQKAFVLFRSPRAANCSVTGWTCASELGCSTQELKGLRSLIRLTFGGGLGASRRSQHERRTGESQLLSLSDHERQFNIRKHRQAQSCLVTIPWWRLIQFGHKHRSKSVGERITVGRTADDHAAGDPWLAHDVADEVEVHHISGRRDFSPLCFEQLQTSADLDREVDLGRAVTPEEEVPTRPARRSELSEDECLPDRACCRCLIESFFRADVQQGTQQTGPIPIFGAFANNCGENS